MSLFPKFFSKQFIEFFDPDGDDSEHRKGEKKTAEQISKHTVEGYLENRSVDRALHLLTVGDELQKISVMKNLPTLIREDLNACIQRVIPRMQQTLPHGSTEYNMGACEAVRTMAQQNLMSPENFTKVFLQHILNSLESKDTVAADEWLNTLLDIIQVLPTNVLQNEILPVAVGKAHISKPKMVRITSCKIIGRLALAFTPFMVKKDIVPVVISLCQDVSGDVRAVMSSELPNISATLGLETGNYLLNHVLELISDEEVMVRQACLQATALMLPRFTPEVLKNTIIPMCKKVFTEVMKNEDTVLVALAKFYGQYCIGLKSVMTQPEKVQFLQRYIQMSQMNSNSRRKLNPYKPMVDEEELALRLTEIRLHCAFNYPAMVLFSSDLKQESIDSLFSVFRMLASDSFLEVRRKIAAGFFEVMKIMPKWHAALKVEFIKLLRDEVDVVVEGLVPNVSNILLGFSASNTLTADRADAGKDIGQALFVCEKNLSEGLHWRLHEELLQAFRVVPKVFHPEFVYLYFVPLLLSRSTNGRILPCRVSALHALLVIVADPSQGKQKIKIRNKILELCNNSSFHCRMLFLRGMSLLINLSPELLKELFFHNITSMAEDKVPNIRLMVCKLLPRLKAVAMDPIDHKLLASIDACVYSLNGEKDRDVLAVLKAALNQMDDLDKNKAVKRGPGSDNNQPSKQQNKDVKPHSGISTLTDMRSFTSEHSSKSTPSQFSQQPRKALGPAGSGRTQSLVVSSAAAGESARSSGISGTSQSAATRKIRASDPEVKKMVVTRLSPEEFLVDAGITLKAATVPVKRIPTPRPVHRPMNTLSVERSGKLDQQDSKENIRKNLASASTPVRPSSLAMVKTKTNITPRPSNLPVKKAILKPMTDEEIEKELMQTETIRIHSPRMSERLKYSSKPTKAPKKDSNSNRYSLDVTDMTNNMNRLGAKSPNINKRYSMDVDSRRVLESKKGLSAINNNNNTLLSPRMGARTSRTGIARPQSCVLQPEKVNNAKRSMSVENLPPKVTRLASRLPVRSTDPKISKPK